jgi:hypothetical protein
MEWSEEKSHPGSLRHRAYGQGFAPAGSSFDRSLCDVAFLPVLNIS